MQDIVLNLGSYQLNLKVAQQADGEHMVAIRPLCDALGVDERGQTKKLVSDPKFSCGHMTSTGSDGKNYQMVCIPVCEVAGWLYSINSRKVSEQVRDKLLAFQKHLQVVIHEHLSGNLTVERLKSLEQAVQTLSKYVAELTFKVIEQQETIQELQAQKRTTEHRHSIEASNAGRTLAAAKQTKKAIN